MSLSDAKQTNLYEHISDEPNLAELQQELEEKLNEQRELTREIINLSRFISKHKRYRQWIK